MPHWVSSRQRYMLFIIVAVELAAAAFLGTRLIERNLLRGSLISINPIKREDLASNEKSRLQYFYEPIPNTVRVQKESWLPRPARYTINADALNERFDYPISKSAEAFRIIAIGDSFTYGLTVNTADNYPERLEDLLNDQCGGYRFEVINLGVGGYDIEYAVERFRLRGMKYNPDLVVWLLSNHDFEQIFEKLAPKFQEYRSAGLFSEEQFRIGPKQDKFWPPAYRKAMREIESEMGLEGILRYQHSALRKINEYYRGPLAVFLNGDRYLSTVEDFVRERPSTWFLSFPPNAVSSYWQRGFYRVDGHPDERGYKLIAEEIFKFLLQKKIIPCG